MSIGRLLLRVVVGGYFVGHGTQKLFGWFGGHGIEATAGMFGQLGLRPPKAHAVAAGAAETAGGTGLMLGAATPASSALLIATMLTAIRTVHWRNGPWVTDQGYEYNLVLIALALALTETGPGSPSVDSVRGVERRGAKWALIALLLGVIGAAGAQASSQFFPAPNGEDAAAGGGEAGSKAGGEAQPATAV